MPNRAVGRNRPGGREGAFLVLLVERLARLPDGGSGAQQRGHQDDGDLENQDLVGERKPGLHLFQSRSYVRGGGGGATKTTKTATTTVWIALALCGTHS